MPRSITAVMGELVTLEQQVSDAAKAINAHDELRVYDIPRGGVPELPCIWNTIDDGEHRRDDTARSTTALTIVAVIGVAVTDVAEMHGQAWRLMDRFLEIVPPAIWTGSPLGGTVNRAELGQISQDFYDLGGVPVFGSEFRISVELSRII